ncbi:mitochondrial ribosomal death-associated protein 3-domain-containing protein [Xylaria sp. CBS 124048]|nr:mitochondrial ribosomal death-associated protein 3-domain-containing protein [Xylaria sp. CBS 124048]
MASIGCWRCLVRPSQRLYFAPLFIAPSTSTSAAFSTSAQQWAEAPRHFRAGKRLILGKKKRPQERVKSPQSGERKAFRKRIQLTNDNALEVPGLDAFSPELAVNPDSVGKVVKLPDIIDQLRACEAFKPTQNWNLFRSPHMLVRSETVEMVRQMTEAIKKKQALRLVITGNRGSGKSILGLQALATGFLKKWVVINIPEGQELTTAATEYAPIPKSQMFSQPVYTVKLMQTMAQTNHQVLSEQKVELDHMQLPITATRGTTLAGLLTATKEPDFAWPFFEAFLQEMLLPGRPPIVFCLDGLAHVMRVSEYRAPDFSLIHSYDLSLVRFFTDALGGKIEFPNGAAIIGITSRSNGRIIPSLEMAVAQQRALLKGEVPPPRDPFYRGYDERVFETLDSIKLLDVQGVSRPEARSVMEYWAASGILRLRVDEKNVAEKWTMAGGGVLAEMERVALYDIRAAQ